MTTNDGAVPDQGNAEVPAVLSDAESTATASAPNSGHSGVTVASTLAALQPWQDFVAAMNNTWQRQVVDLAAAVHYSVYAGAVNAFKQYVHGIRQTLDAFRSISEITSAFSELVERYNITEQEAMTILRRYKWLPFYSMPTSFLFRVAEAGRQPGNQTAAINRMFQVYFLANECHNLAEMVNDWENNPLFRPRMKILRDCVEVIRRANGCYNPANVVLPTLISQTDGILTEYLRGKVTNPSGRRDEFKGEFARLTKSKYFDEIANHMLLHVLFARTLDKNNRPVAVTFHLNRHKVIHGEFIRYGTTPYMLRLFLILDYLAHL